MENNRGFSLIEMSIVLAIIISIMALVAPRLAARKTPPKQVLQKITQNFKQIRNRAKLYGATYRLAFRLSPEPQAYWVEKSSSVTLIDKAALEEIQKKQKEQFRSNGDEKTPPSPFQPDTSFFKKEQTLPTDYKFKLIESGSLENSFSEGTAYIHFFPQGYIEPAVVQVEDPKKNVWTLIFNSITGQSDILSEARTLKELSQ